ncbi:universal stress protein [Acinetobacter sp. ANC 5414]|uniref:universal stress protein n=1 Tax=Acinetobacter sp. ANC 5414 TaxID=2731251 RepID=UPI00149060A0|nr:universal stress protein [Acinetobacter sp. ANC 5414]NNH01759.1 universal stress protein [Acinetobacter sp. ANC 5414]
MSYQNILVPVDGSKISFSAVKHAVEIAQVFNSRLTLISLVSEDPFTDADFYYYYVSAPMKEHFIQAYANAEEILKQASEIAYAAGVQVETKVLKSVLLEEGIVEIAKQLETDLIVMGSHGRKGFKKWRLGSVATGVLCSTELPVMIIKY